MRKAFSLFLCYLFILAGAPAQPAWIAPSALQQSPSPANTWMGFRRAFSLDAIPDTVKLQIAADTKYWLWLNDSLIVREGGLKWGPTPHDCYVDGIDIAPFLKIGENKVEALVWHFGKDGFSHRNSGRAGLWLKAEGIGFLSDERWQGALHPAFGETAPPHPNYRLPESNIHFDARLAEAFTNADAPLLGLPASEWEPVTTFRREKAAGIPRPIPFWKDFGLREYENAPAFPISSQGDTIIVKLPYNAQVTPWFDIEAPAGLKVDIRTDNYKGGSAYNMRSEYLTRAGRQSFETPGWINGHEVRYHFPKGITVHGLRFRESGYDTEFSGSFECEEEFYNTLWQKARRTLYITMRDNYMDCPDRERAQWWGDVVLELEEAFYALDTVSHRLAAKGIRELAAWQRLDSTLYSPVPAGNWNQELPMQMMASAGYYGFWNYYLHTGDTALIREVYPAVERYLGLWHVDSLGLVIPRSGGWTWGDWGENKDMQLLYNGWYYLLLKGYREMAILLNQPPAVRRADERMNRLAVAFNRQFWTGEAYRHPDYKGATDDRAQALAIVSGIAHESKYPALRKVLQEQYHASPYMEKYVLEALFKMGFPEDALQRMKKRFEKMVASPLTTLWEGWGIGAEGYGGGTYNHAWSGGGLTLLSRKVAGIEPAAAGFAAVRFRPQPGQLEKAQAEITTVRGPASARWEKKGSVFSLETQTRPQTSHQEVWLPIGPQRQVLWNGQLLYSGLEFLPRAGIVFLGQEKGHLGFLVKSGKWKWQSK